MSANASIARFSASGSDVRTRPDADRLLETTNDLCRLLDKQREVGARMARFRPGLPHQRVADHDGASEFAGKRLEPARCIHGGADDGEFEPVEADIPKHDLAIVQSDADLDRRLVAIASVLCSTPRSKRSCPSRNARRSARPNRRRTACRTSPSGRRRGTCRAFRRAGTLLFPFAHGIVAACR